ncbi:MAG: RdgB/HAM1 family non-canonical purine NTP pyrophosphatase [Candidatus Omnitrophica bacterium]|nr:RdgB/HAM1 family non-canonical purine NTP pyrophosphatase [Candidatus Omnitrophota bacterium]MDD5553591.1 RdgB/HAM1 family non-canonical purine NTP pyrophosphatase [Candidatus Omnitrophota bacterium]
MDLVVATKNKKKLQEIKEILKGLDLKITSLVNYPKTPRIVENGKTFRENAIKKAVTIAKFTRKLSMGEDSGLCVDALGGKPGVYSARFSGKPAGRTGRDKSDEKNNQKLLKMLKGLPLKKRKAHYHCAVALADKDGLVGVAEGTCGGLIGFEKRGNFGFGYDPLFLIPRYKKTFAELGPRVKHRMSHRFRALLETKKLLATYLK